MGNKETLENVLFSQSFEKKPFRFFHTFPLIFTYGFIFSIWPREEIWKYELRGKYDEKMHPSVTKIFFCPTKKKTGKKVIFHKGRWGKYDS